MCSNNQWLTIKYTLIHALKMLLHTDQQRMLTKKTNVERLRQMSIRFASVRKQQIMKVTAQEYIYIYIQESFIVPCTWILVWYWVFTLKQIEKSTWIGGKKSPRRGTDAYLRRVLSRNPVNRFLFENEYCWPSINTLNSMATMTTKPSIVVPDLILLGWIIIKLSTIQIGFLNHRSPNFN